MINEYLLPIYSSKQGASTLEQQLIKNLTERQERQRHQGRTAQAARDLPRPHA